VTEKRCVGGCCDNRPGWEWIEDPVTHAREKRRQVPQPGQHGTDGHECHPRMAADGSSLCPPCERHLHELIVETPSYAHDLEASVTHSGERQRTDTGDESPDFAGQRKRWAALDQLAHDVAWWADMIATTRGLTRPTKAGNLQAQIQAGCDFAARHSLWLAARTDDPHPISSWKSIRYEAASAMDLPRDRARFEVGPCPENCEGLVWAFIGTQAADSAMGCDLDTGHQWNPAQFYRAGTRIKRKMDGAA
jgi:hypothetical protein